MNDDLLRDVDGTAQVMVALRIAHQVLNEAQSGFLALAADPDRKAHNPALVPVWQNTSEAVSAVVRAEELLLRHQQAMLRKELLLEE